MSLGITAYHPHMVGHWLTLISADRNRNHSTPAQRSSSSSLTTGCHTTQQVPYLENCRLWILIEIYGNGELGQSSDVLFFCFCKEIRNVRWKTLARVAGFYASTPGNRDRWTTAIVNQSKVSLMTGSSPGRVGGRVIRYRLSWNQMNKTFRHSLFGWLFDYA